MCETQHTTRRKQQQVSLCYTTCSPLHTHCRNIIITMVHGATHHCTIIVTMVHCATHHCTIIITMVHCATHHCTIIITMAHCETHHCTIIITMVHCATHQQRHQKRMPASTSFYSTDKCRILIFTELANSKRIYI